jgi:formylglycine-generating enzyme required for sulfatase activity
VDALTTDSVALNQFAQDNPELMVIGEPFTEEPYGLGLPNFDDRFQDLVNFTLQEMKRDGTYDRLYHKWFGTESKPFEIEFWPGTSYLGVNFSAMIKVPAGEFIRGQDNGLNNEGPAKTITLDEFYIDQYEVTNHQYAQCVQSAQCANPRLANIKSFAEYYAQLPSHPVVGVSWNDAQDYCEFMGKRLPTEAEWEKAARGTDGRLYPWGNNEPTVQLANVAPFSRGLTQVGSFPDGVSPYDLFDMSGNVREWVADWYTDFYYQDSPSKNPSGPGQMTTKAVRGGAYNEANFREVSTVRRKGYRPDPTVYDPGMGFRCAASSFPEPK